MNVIAMIAVLFLHCNDCFWKFSNDHTYWESANFIESFFYFAVPIFYMIPGITLMDFYKKYNLKQYLKKRFYRTVIPYIIWSLIGLNIQIFILHFIKIEEINFIYIIDGLLNGSLVVIYWFFIPLFMIYLCIPVFAVIDEEKKVVVSKYIVILAFLFNVLLPFAVNFFHIPIHLPNIFSIGSGCLIFVFIGYVLSKEEFSRVVKFCIYIISMLGLLLHMVGTYFLSMQAGQIVQTFKGYTNLPSILWSIGVFVLLKELGSYFMQKKLVNRIVNCCSKYSYGIYLIHWYILQFCVERLHMNKFALKFRIAFPFVLLLMSMGVIRLLRKVKIFRYILP